MKKLLLLTFFALSTLAFAKDPCSHVYTIQCGALANTSYGHLDPAFPNGMNGQGCSSDTLQGGPAKIFKFIVPSSGTYQLNVTLVSGTNYFEYYYKTSAVCDNTGWNCIGRTVTAASMGAFNWMAGDTILILTKAELMPAGGQQFTILCTTELCNNIQTINCNDTASINLFGYGDPDYPNNMNGQGCDTIATQGGGEIINSFIVPSTGIYQLNVFGGQGGNKNVAYYYKGIYTACSNANWTCVGKTSASGTVALGTFYWQAGDTVLLLANAEQTGTTYQNFSISNNITGIDQLDANTTITIYPNPSKDILTIKVNNNAVSEIIIYDIACRKLMQQQFTNAVTLNTEQLSKGIYLYEVRNKNGLIKKGKVVKD